MNKMFTTAMAIAAVAGLASAEIATPTAGYTTNGVANAEQGFIGIPFASIADADDPATLGDIIGANGDEIKVISAAGKTLFTASYDSSGTPAGWYDGSACSNSYPLARGTSVHFTSGSNHELFMSGSLVTDSVEITLVKTHNFIGNAVPFGKKLSDFTLVNHRPFNDYVVIGSEKYVYLPASVTGSYGKQAGWYLKSAAKNLATATRIVGDNDVDIPAGTGFRAYVPQAGATTKIIAPAK